MQEELFKTILKELLDIKYSSLSNEEINQICLGALTGFNNIMKGK